jgi:hypothetical protein
VAFIDSAVVVEILAVTRSMALPFLVALVVDGLTACRPSASP